MAASLAAAAGVAVLVSVEKGEVVIDIQVIKNLKP
jgi:hypothetical protein